MPFDQTDSGNGDHRRGNAGPRPLQEAALATCLHGMLMAAARKADDLAEMNTAKAFIAVTCRDLAAFAADLNPRPRESD